MTPTAKTETVTDLVLQLSQEAVPAFQPETSPALTEIIARVDTFLVIPNEAKLPAAEVKRLAKDRREKAVREVMALIPVKDEESYAKAAGFAKECGGIMVSIVACWNDIKTKAHRTHEAICKREARDLAPKEVIRDACTNNMLEYKRLELEERRRREREATAKADAERLRLAREEQAKQAEQSRLEAAAREARRQGDIKAAREMTAQAATVKQEIAVVKEEASQVTEEVVHAPAAKAAGVTDRKGRWSGECFDIKLLMQAVLDGKIVNEYLVPVRGGPDEMMPIVIANEEVLNYLAQRLQDSMAIPGCRPVEGKLGLSIKKG